MGLFLKDFFDSGVVEGGEAWEEVQMPYLPVMVSSNLQL